MRPMNKRLRALADARARPTNLRARVTGPLKTVWLVCDPTRHAVLEDICWEQDLARLEQHILGSPRGAWIDERYAMYLTREEAETDANARLAARRKGAR